MIDSYLSRSLASEGLAYLSGIERPESSASRLDIVGYLSCVGVALARISSDTVQEILARSFGYFRISGGNH